MTTFEVLDTYGAAALTRFLASVALFLLLHLLRWLLLLPVRVLDVAMSRVDAYATRQANPVIIAHTRAEPRREHRSYAYAS